MCLDHQYRHPSVQGRSLADSSEAGQTPQEAQTREEVRLTSVKLDRPDSSWERHQQLWRWFCIGLFEFIGQTSR